MVTDQFERSRRQLLEVMSKMNNPPMRGPHGGSMYSSHHAGVLSGGVMSGGVLSGGIHAGVLEGGMHAGKKKRTRKPKGGTSTEMPSTTTAGMSAGMSAGKKRRKKGGKSPKMEKMEKMESPKKKGGATKWIQHVKSYAAKHKMPYGEAMIKAKASYKK
jgi:hypothetical protein